MEREPAEGQHLDGDRSWSEMSGGMSDRLDALRRAADALDEALDVSRREISTVAPRLDEQLFGVGPYEDPAE